jgi:1-acyl-sn-glycerol-3-phosphate acyltransferase
MNDFTPLDLNYRTAPRPVTLVTRIFPGLAYYSRFLWVILKASFVSKRGRYGDAQWCRSSYDILKILEKVGVCFEISGLEHIQQLQTPCVVVANHMSVLETMVLPVVIQPFRDMTFIVKDSLMNYPVFKHILRSRAPIVVNRINPRQDLKTVMQEGLERLDNGISVVVFPQTTRSTSFDPDKFNSIGIKLAAKANVPVVPLALVTDAWGNGKIIKEFGKIDASKTVYFSFGKPLFIHGRGAEQHRSVIDFISSHLDQWRKSLPA